MPFRPQDWSRLKKIAEGNPDESKIGAFGVGAYTMFSICEEPLVISGSSALAFVWKGDALYTKTSVVNTNNNNDVKRRNNKKDNSWTSFILPSRDPYPLPNLTEFGEFLCASLTFTKSLSEIRVYVNDELRLNIVKTLIQDPTPVEIQKNSSWWRSDGAITASPNGIFSLKDTTNSFLESFYHIQVTIDGENAAVTARYLSALAKTNITAAMTKRMERVTKKRPPSNVEVHIFLSGQEQFDENSMKKRDNKAYRILQSFSPSIGEGRIFIGFRTSQTTGVAAHLHAPFVPTVEREAMDLQDQALRTFNLELLQFSGILMRLTLEHGMNEIGMEYNKGAKEREQLDEQFLKQEEEEKRSYTASQENNLEQELDASNDEESVSNSSTSALFGFAKYMAQTVKKKIVSVKTKMEEIIDFEGGELLHPRDPRPLCQNESKAIILMQSFCPRQSTPDPLVGTFLAQGFSLCFNNKSPPVLTRVCGVIPGEKARLPNKGIEAFCKDNVVRTIVYENAKEYHDFVANCQKLNLQDLKIHLKNDVLKEKELVRFMKWWVRFTKIHTHNNISSVEGAQIKDHIRFTLDEDETPMIYNLQNFLFYTDEEKIPTGAGYTIYQLPMPDSVLPSSIQTAVTTRLLTDPCLNGPWFSPLPIDLWVDFISQHSFMNSSSLEKKEDELFRLRILSTLSLEYERCSSVSLEKQKAFGAFCFRALKDKQCIPFVSAATTTSSPSSPSKQQPSSYSSSSFDFPTNLYLNSSELKAFDALGNFHKRFHQN